MSLPRYSCDFCTRTRLTPFTNIGSNEEKIFACKRCIEEKKLLSKLA